MSDTPDVPSTRGTEPIAETLVQVGPQKAAVGTTATVPGYEVLGELGRGGMGVVYKARHLGLNRLVALKMILSGAHAGEDSIRRFRSEAETLALIQHPAIIQVFDIGEHEGNPYFAMEYVEGGSLDRLLAGRPQRPRDSAALVETLARAVHVAHAAGIVHRDLKPANILLASLGRKSQENVNDSEDGPSLAELVPKITDFGLARRLTVEGQTISGAVLGTPAYMSPEQAFGQVHAVGPASDVHALGVILFELLVGRVPFKGTSVLEALDQVRPSVPTADSWPPSATTVNWACGSPTGCRCRPGPLWIGRRRPG